ncbi:MAG: hypothetical protein WC637_06405 [Victivallales bacterium]
MAGVLKTAEDASKHLDKFENYEKVKSQCTEIEEMSGAARKTEISRMLGGGAAAAKHAGEMLLKKK